jgi:hypothetical protein
VDIRDPGVAGVGAHSVSRHGAAVIVRVVLAALSFLIYVAAVLSLHQERTVPLLVEQDGPIPVVISHWLCRAPFGLTDSGLKDLSAIPPVLLALTWLLITLYFRTAAPGVRARANRWHSLLRGDWDPPRIALVLRTTLPRSI